MYSIVSHPGLDSDPPFGSDRDRGASQRFSPRGFVGIMLPSLASLSLFICFSMRVEALLFFLGNGVLAFSGLSRLLGVLHLPGELL